MTRELSPQTPHLRVVRTPEAAGHFLGNPDAPVNRDETCLLIGNVRRLMQRRFSDTVQKTFTIKPRSVRPSDYQCPDFNQFSLAEPAAGAFYEERDHDVQMNLAVRVREPGMSHYKVSVLSFFGSALVSISMSPPGFQNADVYSSTRYGLRAIDTGDCKYEEADHFVTPEAVTVYQARAAFNLMRGAAGFPAVDFSKIPPVPPQELSRVFASMGLPLSDTPA